MGVIYYLATAVLFGVLVVLFAGLINPQIFSRQLKRFATRKHIVLASLAGVLVLSFVLSVTEPAGVKSVNTKKQEQPKVAQSAETESTLSNETTDVKAAEVEIKDVEEKEAVPFTSQQQNDSKLPIGQAKIIQAGVNGEKTRTYAVTYTDGEETDRSLKSEVVNLQPVTQITAIGTYKVAVAPTTPTTPASNCNIKGNISISSGEKIYHVPGQQYYDETVISPDKGERYFCSAAEAEAAGWRASQV